MQVIAESLQTDYHNSLCGIIGRFTLVITESLQTDHLKDFVGLLVGLLRFKGVGFSSKVGQIGPKVDKSGTSSDQNSVLGE